MTFFKSGSGTHIVAGVNGVSGARWWEVRPADRWHPCRELKGQV